jgi:hypothetical protein
MGRKMIYGTENSTTTYQRRRPIHNKILTDIRKYNIIRDDYSELFSKNDDELDVIFHNIQLEKIIMKIEHLLTERANTITIINNINLNIDSKKGLIQ